MLRRVGGNKGCDTMCFYLLSPTTEVEVNVVSNGGKWHKGAAAVGSWSFNPIKYPSFFVNSCTASSK